MSDQPMGLYNPAQWFLKHRRSCLIALGLMIPPAYLASYPVMYRVVIGSDADRATTAPYLERVRTGKEPSQEAIRRWRIWQKLERYYFPPARWTIDNTPFQRPVLLVARSIGVHTQFAGELVDREHLRRVNEAARTGNRSLIDAETTRFIAKMREIEPAMFNSSPSP